MERKQPNTIVIIDDDIDLDEILKYSFESRGFDVKEIYNCQDALEYLQDPKNSSDIALVILDRLLPDSDGIEVLKKISSKKPATYPVIILSKLTSESEQLLGFKFGTLDYIPKPFNLKILVEKAISVIQHCRAKKNG